MNKSFYARALVAAAICGAGAAHASSITFDDPGLITIDPDTLVATYVESGFAFTGPATSFLPLDSALLGGADLDGAPLTLSAVGGGAFSLASVDDAFFDLGAGPAGGLTVTGFVGAMQVATQVLALGSQVTTTFGGEFAHVTSVTFTSPGGYELDNVDATTIAAVPEPATWALSALGLAGLMTWARRAKVGTINA